MSLVKRPSVAVLMILLVLAGAATALCGVYLLLGLAWTLVVGGAAAVALGLLADV